ncbi:hypothetical protein [Pseudomonas fluorescens]|uniref:hypothetical protein n=1 Tax=Pseudomonas fluorescens TaxID=294 RepID=UPI000935F553|nr:hypothetical protein [Pseudomonas fluorescens]
MAGGFVPIGSPILSETSRILARPLSQKALYSTVVFGPSKDFSRGTLEGQKQRIDAYAVRVLDLIDSIESGKEGERNIRFQQARQFLEPAGYFSAGLLAAGYDPQEKITVTFNSYVGKWKPEVRTNTDKRTYFAWEIAAGALKHDRAQEGGLVNFQTTRIEPQDQSKIDNLEALGAKLQDHWEDEIAKPMRDESGALAKRSGNADVYVLRGTLQSLVGNKASFEKLSLDARKAIHRTLNWDGQVIIPNIYGYPLAGYAFIPYLPFDGDVEHRPNKGVMIDLKNGTLSEIRGDREFSEWAKNNRDNVVSRFNARDRQGGKDAHWPKAGDVLDNYIAGNHASYPGRKSLLVDQAVPVWGTFNYTKSRGSDYVLKYGSLRSGLAAKYQALNAKNAVWSDQTQVFGSSQQRWKAAKEFWGSTFGYVPVLGNIGNVVFGAHDGIYGMTANDRVGGNAAAVISGLQLAHELLHVGAEAAVDKPLIPVNASANERYRWHPTAQPNELELTRISNPAATPISTPASSFPGMREVKFRGKKYFAADKPDVADGEHYKLQVLDPKDPSKLAYSGIAAKPDEAGVWKKMGISGGGLKEHFSLKFRNAREELDAVVEQHANMALPAKEEEVERFTETMTKLIGESNADDFGLIETYTHADSDFVNGPLRAGKSTPELEAFLLEFNQLNAYEGKAYRSAFVTAEGAKRIKENVGKVFQDSGVQSASATVRNSAEWEGWAKGAAKQRTSAAQQVVYVFDESIPKKNLSTDFLKDHVAIGAGEFMKVLAFKEQGEKLFVYVSSPSKLPKHIYNVFDGKLIY